MPSGRGPWTVSNDGGVPAGAIVVGAVFAWMGVAVVAWVLRNEALIYAGMGLTAAGAVAVFVRTWLRERRVQTWRPVRKAAPVPLPELPPVPVPAAIEGRKVIPGVVEPEVVAAWMTSSR